MPLSEGMSTMKRKQSLEVLSLRVSDLLEGLDDADVETESGPRQNDAQLKFVRFRQKLEALFMPKPDETKERSRGLDLDTVQAEALLSELDELGNFVTKKHHRHVSSAFMGELVETVQILLKESMPSTLEAGPSAQMEDRSKFQATPFLKRIQERIRKLSNKSISSKDMSEMQLALESVQADVERFGNHLNKLQQERNDLVRLVSSGQEIMADLVKENESLEHQLTLHIMAQKKTLMGEPPSAKEEATDHPATHKDLSRTHSGSCSEDDLLRLVFKEKTKAEVLEQQAKHLAIQASNAQRELEELKAQKIEIMGALDQEKWIEDRDKLLQMLEDEKDKVSTWKEEQEELQHQLKDANEKITCLQEDKEMLQKAAEETSWAEYRQKMLEQSQEDQEQIKELMDLSESYCNNIEKLHNEKTALEEENSQLKEELSGGSAWEKQELSLKLTLAEKQNRLLELTSENTELEAALEESQSHLEEAHTELEALRQQVEEVAWADDRNALLQALEKEIDKRAMWEEERATLEQQLATLSEEQTSLKTENASLRTSFDEVSWAREREELCRALEEEKEKLSSWTEEIEALEEENKSLKWVFHEVKEKNMIIEDKEEAIEHLNEELEILQSQLGVKEDEIQELTSTLTVHPETWVQEKVALVNQVAELKLSRTSLEESLKQEALKHQACLIRIEELEIEIDRLERDIHALKSAAASRKHVSWGSTSIVEIPEVAAPSPLSINISKSHSRFEGGSVSEAPSQLCCHLSVRVPHHRSKSIPPSLQL